MGRAVFALAAILVAVGAPAAHAAPGEREPVSADEEQAFLSAVERRSVESLNALFAHRISLGHGVGDFELKGAEQFLRELDGCSRQRVVRFRNDPELFVEWICPARPWRRPEFEAEGYVTMVWHHPAGLTLAYHPSGITVRPPGPPSPSTRP